MSELMLKMNDKTATNEYSEKLFNGEYFEQLGEELEEEISNVVEISNYEIWVNYVVSMVFDGIYLIWILNKYRFHRVTP